MMSRQNISSGTPWESIVGRERTGRVHGEFFGDVRPTSTMVGVSKLINPDHLIEIEVDAFVTG